SRQPVLTHLFTLLSSPAPPSALSPEQPPVDEVPNPAATENVPVRYRAYRGSNSPRQSESGLHGEHRESLPDFPGTGPGELRRADAWAQDRRGSDCGASDPDTGAQPSPAKSATIDTGNARIALGPQRSRLFLALRCFQLPGLTRPAKRPGTGFLCFTAPTEFRFCRARPAHPDCPYDRRADPSS